MRRDLTCSFLVIGSGSPHREVEIPYFYACVCSCTSRLEKPLLTWRYGFRSQARDYSCSIITQSDLPTSILSSGLLYMPPPPPLHYAGASPYQPESPCTNQDGTTLSSEKQNSFNLTSATGSGEHPATQPGAREQTNTRVIRPLTVNEALQYSPFSSIVPFNSGTISFSFLYSLLK